MLAKFYASKKRVLQLSTDTMLDRSLSFVWFVGQWTN
jgi:hypothetical protein